VSESGSFEKRAEFAAYRRTLSFIGSLLVIFSGTALLFAFFIPYLISLFTHGYTYDFYSGHIYGENGVMLSLILTAAGSLTAYIAMIAVGVLYLKIPVNVIFPVNIISKRLCVSGVLIAPMLSAVTLIYRRSIGFPAFTLLFGSDEHNGFTAVRIILYVLLIPVLSELAFRGVLLTLLRQFGDISAVIVTALLSSTATCAVMGGNLLGVSVADMPLLPLALFPASFLCSLCYGYFTFASGSVVTPILMKIIVSGANVLYLALCDTVNTGTSNLILYIAGFAVFLCGFFTVLRIIINAEDDIEIIGNKNYLTPADKIYCMTQPMFILPFLFLVLVSILPN
jgi:membrane protease YdiL (CAAX protease family)